MSSNLQSSFFLAASKNGIVVVALGCITNETTSNALVAFGIILFVMMPNAAELSLWIGVGSC